VMLFDKLRQIEERSNGIARALADPAVLAQPSEYARLRKEYAETLEVVERFTEYRDVLKRIGEARLILAEGGDRELQELAQAEISCRATPTTRRTSSSRSARVRAATRRRSSRRAWRACTRNTPSASAGKSR